jgi:octaprenyl-diphosphate synthase
LVNVVVVPLRTKRDEAVRPSLETLQQLVAADLAQVNETILHRMSSRVALIPELAGHLISGGGKRLRPMLTLASARLCGYAGTRHVLLAACVEFIHTATLLHDDVVDGSHLRRGSPTANAMWGNQPSVLVGDFLFSRAFQLMVAAESMKVLGILADASAVIAEGEIKQLLTSNNTDTTEDAYLEVVMAKTASLFAAACRVSAVIAGRPQAEEEALESYGRNLGIAFQLVDDVLDFAAREDALGKHIGDDFRDGKITLPVMLAYRRGDHEERTFWQRTLVDGDQNAGDLEHALTLMKSHGTLTDTLERARHYGAIARDALAIFPDRAEKRALLQVVDFCIARSY